MRFSKPARVALVIPAHNEGSHIRETVRAILDTIEGVPYIWDVVLVDDGSTDDTWEVLVALSQRFDFVRAVRLSRGFGKEAALCAGLESVDADACIVMDADLQHPPEIIPEMLAKWVQGYEVVEAVKSSRGRESIMYRAFAGTFYSLAERITGYPLGGSSDFRLLDRRVLDAWRAMPEHHTFFRGMTTWLGYHRSVVQFDVRDRVAGKSSFTLFKLMRLAITAITSFSSAPLHAVTVLGFGFLIGSLVLGAQTIVRWASGTAVDGFTTVILLQLIIGSAIMISIGVIGEYIGRIFEEVKQRPRYVVRDRTEAVAWSEEVAPSRKIS